MTFLMKILNKFSGQSHKGKSIPNEIQSSDTDTRRINSFDILIPSHSKIKQNTNDNKDIKPIAGEGTVDDPWQISTADELRMMGGVLGMDAHYVLIADIDLNGSIDNQWMPIGSNKEFPIGDGDMPFSGILDGNGYTISGIYIDRREHGQALFGYTEGATIKNIKVKGCITSHDSSCTAGIVGYAKSTTIIGCVNEVSVKASYYIGGIAGWIYDNSIIEDCRNNADLNAKYHRDNFINSKIGGIVGLVNDHVSTINRCHNTGNISGDSHVGGIVGELSSYYGLWVYHPELSVKMCQLANCCNAGEIRCNAQWAGGIVGTSGSTPIVNCYNAATVKLIHDSELNSHENYRCGLGGIVGGNGSGSIIKNCYNIGAVIAKKSYMHIGSIIGGNGEKSIIIDCYYDKESHKRCVGTNNGKASFKAISSYDDLIIMLNSNVETYLNSNIEAYLNKYVRHVDYCKWVIGPNGYPIFSLPSSSKAAIIL